MSVRIRATALAIALLALPGCQDDGPVGPTTEDFQAAREEMAKKLASGKKPPKPAPVVAARPAATNDPSSFGAIERGYYDPTGKRDPFRSFEWEQLKLELMAGFATLLGRTDDEKYWRDLHTTMKTAFHETFFDAEKKQYSNNSATTNVLALAFDLVPREQKEVIFNNLVEKINFVPDAIIVDGLDFAEAGREIFEGFKAIGTEYQVETWFSALSQNQVPALCEGEIPHPCTHLADLFSIILQLQPTQTGIILKLLLYNF